MDTLLVAALILAFGAKELFEGTYARARSGLGDWVVNFVSIAHLSLFIKPLIVFASAYAAGKLLPGQKGAFASLPLWLGTLFVILPDELLHYAYHRKAHEWPWLWEFHKTHHTQPDVHIWTSFRENIFWFVLMPNLWYSATLVYFGLGKAYVISNVLIGTADILSHTRMRFYLKYREAPVIGRLYRVFEKIIVFPHIHLAHHGNDANSAPNGNYGTLFMFYDILFKSDYFPSAPPKSFGLMAETPGPWYRQLYWPFKSRGAEPATPGEISTLKRERELQNA